MAVRLARVSRIVPNDWNMNEMEKYAYLKMKNDIAKALFVSGEVSEEALLDTVPILVRPVEIGDAKYQIVDGEHRWRAYKDLGIEKILVQSKHMSEARARALTPTLNYLRGKPDPKRYEDNVVELVKLGMTISEISDILPNSEEDINDIIGRSGIDIESFIGITDGDDETSKNSIVAGEDDWIELKFRLTPEQAEVIEQEITRIADYIGGKNARARALEYVAANSRSCPLPTEKPTKKKVKHAPEE